jgi:DNA helicase IV
MREGVLVVGPNRVFLDYIAGVLPSLGERYVEQRAVPDLVLPRIEIGGTDTSEVTALKGDARWVTVVERAARARLRPPQDEIVIPHGLRRIRVGAEELAGWMDDALAGRCPEPTARNFEPW